MRSVHSTDYFLRSIILYLSIILSAKYSSLSFVDNSLPIPRQKSCHLQSAKISQIISLLNDSTSTPVQRKFENFLCVAIKKLRSSDVRNNTQNSKQLESDRA